jgi:hypothetical protein
LQDLLEIPKVCKLFNEISKDDIFWAKQSDYYFGANLTKNELERVFNSDMYFLCICYFCNFYKPPYECSSVYVSVIKRHDSCDGSHWKGWNSSPKCNTSPCKHYEYKNDHLIGSGGTVYCCSECTRL